MEVVWMGEDRENVQKFGNYGEYFTLGGRDGYREKTSGLVRKQQPSKHGKYPVGNLGKLGVTM